MCTACDDEGACVHCGVPTEQAEAEADSAAVALLQELQFDAYGLCIDCGVSKDLGPCAADCRLATLLGAPPRAAD